MPRGRTWLREYSDKTRRETSITAPGIMSAWFSTVSLCVCVLDCVMDAAKGIQQQTTHTHRQNDEA